MIVKLSSPEIRIFFEDGILRAVRDGSVSLYNPMVRAIEAIRDPAVVAEAFHQLKTTGKVPGFVAGVDVASIYLEADAVVAEISLSSEDFEERISHDAFEPILSLWQQVWNARTKSTA